MLAKHLITLATSRLIKMTLGKKLWTILEMYLKKNSACTPTMVSIADRSERSLSPELVPFSFANYPCQ